MENSQASWPPGLTQSQALGLLVAYCIIYILPLYASSSTRPTPGRSRDAPEAIRARIRSVSLSTAICSVATLFLLPQLCHNTTGKCNPLHLMGYWPIGFPETTRALLLTSLLYAGPLYECLIIDGVWKEWAAGAKPLRVVWSDLPTWRNMVAGPATEECLFRAAAVPLLVLAGSSNGRIITFSPVVFGLAHLHHFYEFRITHPQTPLIAAIARSTLQFSYTSIFGAYANFLFLRTGSLLAVIAVHTLCNSIGLPRIWGSVEPYWLSQQGFSHSRSVVAWTSIYYALLIGGSVAWWRNLYPLTLSPMALTEF